MSQLADKTSKALKPTTKHTVQPSVLLRTPIFTPIGRVKSKDENSQDMSSYLRKLEICQREGFDEITITGAPLNVETDFKVWCGILLSLERHGKDNGLVKLPFTEFAKLCGYPSNRFNKVLRRSLDNSVGRIKSQNLKMRKKGEETKSYHTSLVLKAYLDGDEDVVVLQADPDLWEIYRIDHQILISLEVIKQLPRAEVAQCLYLYLASLPQQPHPISLTRLRTRLQLSMSEKEANRSITNAVKKLVDVGYLDGEIKKNSKGERNLYVYGRCQKLLMNRSSLL